MGEIMFNPPDHWKSNQNIDVSQFKKSKYTIVVDYGKPYDINVKTKKQLMGELKKLKKTHDEGDYPYFDVFIYDEYDNDITDEIFKKFST